MDVGFGWDFLFDMSLEAFYGGTENRPLFSNEIPKILQKVVDFPKPLFENSGKCNR